MSRRSNLTNQTVMALVVSALVAGLAVHALLNGGSSPIPAVTTPTAGSSGPGPWRMEGGIPIGFERSEAGATAAAASYSTTGQAMIDLAPTQLHEAVSRYAATQTASAQAATLGDELESLRQVLADGTGRTRYVRSVLATRLDEYTDERATVRVWAVGVLWRQGAADPQADWSTTTFELVWEENTWKVLTESIESGPAPAPNGGTPPVNAAELDRLLDGFETRGMGR